MAYGGWDGGTLGNGAVTGLRFVLGALGYVVPAALVVGGGLVLAREMRPPGRPLRTGVICLTCSITLALAAGTLGVGPGAVPAAEFWHAAAFETRGGVVGQAELWVTSHLISTVGADILAVFLFAAGLILVTGADARGDRAADRRRGRRARRVRSGARVEHGGHPRAPPRDRGGEGPGRADRAGGRGVPAVGRARR